MTYVRCPLTKHADDGHVQQHSTDDNAVTWLRVRQWKHSQNK